MSMNRPSRDQNICQATAMIWPSDLRANAGSGSDDLHDVRRISQLTTNSTTARTARLGTGLAVNSRKTLDPNSTKEQKKPVAVSWYASPPGTAKLRSRAFADQPNGLVHAAFWLGPVGAW